MWEKLMSQGVKVMTGARVEAFEGEGRVERVRLAGGASLPCGAAILAIGAVPNAGLAADAGLKVSRAGAIRVDEYMRTSAPTAYSVVAAALDASVKLFRSTREN